MPNESCIFYVVTPIHLEVCLARPLLLMNHETSLYGHAVKDTVLGHRQFIYGWVHTNHVVYQPLN